MGTHNWRSYFPVALLVCGFLIETTHASVISQPSPGQDLHRNCRLTALEHFCRDAFTVHSILTSTLAADDTQLYAMVKQANIGECPWELPSSTNKDFQLSHCSRVANQKSIPKTYIDQLVRDGLQSSDVHEDDDDYDDDNDISRLAYDFDPDDISDDGELSEHFFKKIKKKLKKIGKKVKKAAKKVAKKVKKVAKKVKKIAKKIKKLGKKFKKVWKKVHKAAVKLYKKSKRLYELAKRYCKEKPEKCEVFVKILSASASSSSSSSSSSQA